MPCELRAVEGAPGLFDLSASSEFPVRRGRYTEVLDHSEGSVRFIASSALFNHDPNQLVGSVERCALSQDKTVRAQIRILPDARLPTGVLALDAVASGALRGVSIGYSIDSYERAEVDGQVQIRATAWTLREISLTPIPADPTVGVGRSFSGDEFASVLPSTTPATVPAKESRVMSDPVAPVAPAAPAAVAPVIDHRAEAQQIATQAEALGLRAADFVGLPMADAKDAMLSAVAKRGAAAPVVASVQITADDADKIRDQAVDSLLAGRSVHDVARIFANRHQRRGVAEWCKRDTTDFILSRAAEVSANFNNVTTLAAQKAMLGGYEGYRPWSDPLVAKMTTGDFKTVRVAGLQIGDFSEPGEGSAFSDATLDDNLTGSGALTFRGLGIELTKEAIYNDELGLFFRKLATIGDAAARHQDIKVAAAMEAASFANASLGTGALAAATLAAAWTAFVNFTGPASQKLGVLPEFLVVPPALWSTAASLLTLNQGGAATAGIAGLASGGSAPFVTPLKPIVGLHLSSTTAFYMAANPAQGGGITVVKHSDYQTPKVFEVDPGLVASRKFRIEFPMAVITATSATGKPVGWGKSTGTT